MKYLETAKEIIANKWYVAVRATCSDEHYEVDDACRESYEWDLENDCSAYHTTGETAGGTCGIGVDAEDCSAEELAARIEAAVKIVKDRGYGDVGGQTVIIAGKYVNRDYQMDDDEIRIRNAWVQEIVK